MTPADLSRTVLHAVRRAVDEDALRVAVPARVRVERTRPGGSGDYACAVALQLARPAALPAHEVARILKDRIAAEPGIGRVEITGPGFLNLTLDASADGAARVALVREVAARGAAYGHGTALSGRAPLLPYAAEVRAAVTADAVAALLRSQGAAPRTVPTGPADPAWSGLGVAAGTEAGTGSGAEAGAAGTMRPVPAGVPAADLLVRLGSDAARWGLLRAAGHDRAALDDGLLVQTAANPLFLVRYAHSRAHAVTRAARALGLRATPDAYDDGARDDAARDHGAPDHTATRHPAAPDHGAPFGEPAALALAALLADHPAVLLAAARHRAPDRLARHLEAVAHAFFDFHDACPPLPAGDEKPSAAHRSRPALAEATGTVLAGGLSLLGISAPEHL
ncbi:DALR anticodon-binding domain-containing protein [Streptomyces sp. NBC_01335]|uniref:ArgS-related anticodon-binding protein NrtL n=1 Tax=Streptomyces sp. NBC_01335 TaxID=2903828 RepID=UPI002E1131BA|nr:DALR anticodon-binding domain-containing protein [Streptomyces sp. NBC_01335]